SSWDCVGIGSTSRRPSENSTRWLVLRSRYSSSLHAFRAGKRTSRLSVDLVGAAVFVALIGAFIVPQGEPAPFGGAHGMVSRRMRSWEGLENAMAQAKQTTPLKREKRRRANGDTPESRQFDDR